MKAMILAAGIGSRLRPLTDSKPKALVEVNGQPMLYWLLLKLKEFGIQEILINLHHFPEQIITYLKKNQNFGLKIVFSMEEILLDTGGGLKKASWFFDHDQPFLLHNADVMSDLDYAEMLETHNKCGALVTLAVRKRKTSRYMLFDQAGELCGWESTSAPEIKMVRSGHDPIQQWSFMGIHIISPRIFQMITEQHIFSIIDVYLRLASINHKIMAFPADKYRWVDLGKAENFPFAAQFFSR